MEKIGSECCAQQMEDLGVGREGSEQACALCK